MSQSLHGILLAFTVGVTVTTAVLGVRDMLAGPREPQGDTCLTVASTTLLEDEAGRRYGDQAGALLSYEPTGDGRALVVARCR
jgi:hypothetical protein